MGTSASTSSKPLIVMWPKRMPVELRPPACATTMSQFKLATSRRGTSLASSGHKTRAVFDRYHIVSPGDLQDVAVRLSAVPRGAAHAVKAAGGDRKVTLGVGTL